MCVFSLVCLPLPIYQILQCLTESGSAIRFVLLGFLRKVCGWTRRYWNMEIYAVLVTSSRQYFLRDDSESESRPSIIVPPVDLLTHVSTSSQVKGHASQSKERSTFDRTGGVAYRGEAEASVIGTDHCSAWRTNAWHLICRMQFGSADSAPSPTVAARQ